MLNASRANNFRLSMQVLITSLVCSLFIAACGSDKTTTSTWSGTEFSCKEGDLPCRLLKKCCPSGYPYHCSNGTCSKSSCPSGTKMDDTCG